MINTVGIDVGSSAIKTVLMSFDDDGRNEKLIDTDLTKIRREDTKDIVKESFARILKKNNLTEKDLSYIATTGEGEMVDFRRGHFYSMTAHSRGALFLNKESRAVVDVGALHAKAIVMDDRSKVLGYRMTSQCASGSGQFLENISKYLGIALDELGKLSKTSKNPEVSSSICAVLAETDVINMVSRGILPSDILKGIHISMGRRMINLLRVIKAEGVTFITGGLSKDDGFVSVLQELADEDNLKISFKKDELSVFAGSIGAAIWGAFRHRKLEEKASQRAV